jgi:predicted sulfurtransferase
MITIHNQFVHVNELKAIVESTFKQADNPIATRKQKPHRVKLNGKYIVTDSRKTIWPSIGAAKNAIRNHISNSMELSKWISELEKANGSNQPKVYTYSYSYDDIKNEIIKLLESNNIIEYVPYTDGE